jgi:hypothetical protein
MTNVNSPRRLAAAAFTVAMSCLISAAHAFDYETIDATDKVALERALFLCQWRISHGAPDNAPTPAVCTSAAVSVDDALLQTKQWWMYWARFDNAGVVKGNNRFGEDFLAFQSRQRQQPSLAAQLLPPGIRLPKQDWRVLLVEELQARAATAGP